MKEKKSSIFLMLSLLLRCKDSVKRGKHKIKPDLFIPYFPKKWVSR